MEVTRRSAIAIAAGFLFRGVDASAEALFDSKTLNGWQLIENNAYSLVTASIKDPPSFTTWMTNGSDPMSEYLRARLQDSVKSGVTDWSAAVPDAATKLSALTRDLNRIIGGPSLYDKDRFNGIVLRRETAESIARHPTTELDIAALNKLLIEDAFPDGSTPTTASPGWVVRDGAMASTGSGRGVIYTDKDYSRFKLSFTMRHVSGNPDHQACVLIFCARPRPDEMPLDALAGIQFQVPNGGHWDYRPDKNNAGNAEFTTITKTQFDPHAWSRIEITADATTGTRHDDHGPTTGRKGCRSGALQRPHFRKVRAPRAPDAQRRLVRRIQRSLDRHSELTSEDAQTLVSTNHIVVRRERRDRPNTRHENV